MHAPDWLDRLTADGFVVLAGIFSPSEITRGHRRIVHLELASDPDLLDGYEWHDFAPLLGS